MAEVRLPGVAHPVRKRTPGSTAATGSWRWIIRLFYDFEGQRNIDGLGRQAHALGAGLITELGGNYAGSHGGVGGNLEFRYQFEIPGVDRNRFIGESVLFELRLGINHARDFE